MADQVVYSFGNMVIAAVLSRHCAQRQFGVYILTQRAMDVLIQLCNVLLWAPLTFNLPGLAEKDRARYQGSVFYLQLIFCVLFTGLLWIATHWTARGSHADLHETFSPLILAGGGILFREYTRRMYFALMRLKEAFWTEVATVCLQIAGVEILYRRHQLDVPHALCALLAGASLVSLWWLIRDGRFLGSDVRSTWRDLRLNLRLGRWFLGSNMVSLASSQCNPWVLAALWGGPSVGAYAVCESVVNIPRVGLNSVQNVMGPMIANAYVEKGTTGVRSLVRRLDRALLLGSAGCAAVIVAIGPYVAHMIFKAVPGNARVVLALLSVNLVFYACTLAQSYGLSAVGRADTTLYANMLGLLTQAAVCLLLVRSFGVSGAAAAMLLGNLMVFVSRSWFFKREMGAA